MDIGLKDVCRWSLIVAFTLGMLRLSDADDLQDPPGFIRSGKI